MFPRLSPWSASPNSSLANQIAILLSFVAVLYYLIKGLDGPLPPVNKALVRSCRLDSESAIRLKALTSKYYVILSGHRGTWAQGH